MTIAAIILAAGASSRMGTPKQMLEISGEKLLKKTAQTVLDSGIRRVAVVLGSDESVLRQLIADLPVDAVDNPEWKRGIGTSIKRGLLHFSSEQPLPEAIIIFVCDQPLLRPANIKTLLQKYQDMKKPIIASRYAQAPGVPVLFDKSYYGQLLALPDDQGAKKILLQNPHDVCEIDFPDGEIDLDTREDYKAFRDGGGKGPDR